MHAASFSPDGSRVVTPSEGGTARLWDLKAGASLLIITRSANFGSTASFSSGGSRVISAETVGQKLNTKNLVQLKVVGKLPRKDTLFRAQEMLRYAGRDSWEPVYICTDTA